MLPDANGQKENKYILGREELQFYVTKKKKKNLPTSKEKLTMEWIQYKEIII